jgi:DNA helicase-2/ATP-dependent DNA helicase PcrA
VKKTSNYKGKTYNSVEGVREFFKKRTSLGVGDLGVGEKTNPQPPAPSPHFRVGARVKHAKYGTGVVLRSEGAGEDTKLTVSFPGYGQKKFVAKFAALESI